MLVPFMLNYLICWYVWATTDKRKAVTWIAAIFSFYPQFVACKVIWIIWSDPKKGLPKKRHLERNLIENETFVEAVPSTLVMAYLLVRNIQEAEGSEIIFDDTNYFDFVLFCVAFSTSVTTSSLGLAKNLKVGPCRILPEQKRFLGGLLSPRFVLIFLSCGFTLIVKGFAFAGGVHTQGGKLSAAGGVIALSLLFLPGLLTGLYASCHKGILKTFLAHPSVFLLPVFSYFTFVSNSRVCCGGEGKTEDNEKGNKTRKEETFITFSPKYTAINAVVSVVGLLVFLFTMPLIQETSFELYGLVLFGTPFIPGLLLTLATTFSNQCNCCRSCCCFSCCTEPFEIGALLPSEPHTSYVLGSDGQLRKEGTGGGLEEEMESMVNDAEEVEVNVVLVEDVEAVERDTSKDLS